MMAARAADAAAARETNSPAGRFDSCAAHDTKQLNLKV